MGLTLLMHTSSMRVSSLHFDQFQFKSSHSGFLGATLAKTRESVIINTNGPLVDIEFSSFLGVRILLVLFLYQNSTLGKF